MERLNEIMMRTAQRRQRPPEEQTGQGNVPQGQRPQPAMRRPLPEQTARLGQPYVAAPQNAEPPLPPRTRDMQREMPPQAARTPYPRPRPPFNGTANPAQRRTTQEPFSPADAKGIGVAGPDQTLPSSPTTWATARVVPSDQVDAYPPAPHADVDGTWEDDAAGMRYGDWEDTGNYPALPQVRPPLSRQIAPTMPGRSPLPPAREHYPVTRSAITRNLVQYPETDQKNEKKLGRLAPLITPSGASHSSRTNPQGSSGFAPGDTRVSQVQPPVPQAPPQEARRYQRMTQPLNPQSLPRLAHDPAQEAAFTQKPGRQMIVRDSSALVASPPAMGICPLCKGAGYLRADVPYGHPNFGKPIACECKEAERKEKRRQQLRDISNLGAFANANFKNFNPNISASVRRAYQIAQDYAEDPYGWLLFIGKNGCGKTHLAAAIANKHLSRGSLVLFTVVTELLNHLRATFAPNATEVYDQLFSRMREAELLILDDLGAQQSSPWANEKLFQLLNYRYNSRFPTIITTNNLGLQGIEDRMRSRLMDASLVTTVTFDGAQDYRPHNPRRD